MQKVHISLNNSKLGDKIPSLNLEAGVTCRKDAPCKALCYARKGNFRYPNVQNSMRNNLEYYKTNPIAFRNEIIEYLNNDDVVYKFFRWFGSGDIVDYKFLIMMIDIAKACPMTKFLAFTKKYELVNIYLDNHTLPENLNIVFSGWDDTLEVPNPYNLPMTYVYFKDSAKNSPNLNEFAIPCKGSCRTCKGCWSLRQGQQIYFNQH